MSQQNWWFLAIFFLSPWANQISYRKSTTMWRKRIFSAFSRWLWIFFRTFGSPLAIKKNCKKLPILIFFKDSHQNWWFWAILFWSPRENQMCYRKSTTIWGKLRMFSFSTCLWSFCSSFGSPMVIKTISPKITDFDVTWVTHQNQIVGLY